jgi:hypothetical protein
MSGYVVVMSDEAFGVVGPFADEAGAMAVAREASQTYEVSADVRDLVSPEDWRTVTDEWKQEEGEP